MFSNCQPDTSHHFSPFRFHFLLSLVSLASFALLKDAIPLGITVVGGFFGVGSSSVAEKNKKIFLLALLLVGKSVATWDYELLGSVQTDKLPAESLHIKPFNHSPFTGLSTDERVSPSLHTHKNTSMHMLPSCCNTHRLKQIQLSNKNHNPMHTHTPIRPHARTHVFNTN